MKNLISLFLVTFFFLSLCMAERNQFELPDDIQFTGSVVDTSPN